MLLELRWSPLNRCLFLLFVTLMGHGVQVRSEEGSERCYIELNRDWTVEVIEGTASEVERKKLVPIEIGREWESVLGDRFDGRAIYRTTISKPAQQDQYQRWCLEIDGAATAARVKVQGIELGQHLGGWTPFQCDITACIAMPSESERLDIEIEVDELVGHNTQGFLPIVVPHFGGIWKSIRLIGYKSQAKIEDHELRVGGFRGEDRLELEVPVELPKTFVRDEYQVEFRISNGSGADLNWQPLPWKSPTDNKADEHKDFVTQVAAGFYRPEKINRWSPEDPFLYELQIRLSQKSPAKVLDVWTTKGALREVRTDGRRLLLNGKPIAVRGLLNWGYAPPRLSPTLDEKWIRDELVQAKLRGFNLMKLCLWVPPKKYFELADELGMLIWMEYPTWHPDFSEKKLADLKQEFREFFYYDRNHPSVLVRSLTCETGPGADLKVIQELYDLAHREIPGAVVEDDSSWIQWNRISDFYDDHPYGNNHTWRQKLEELDRYILERESKPLLLGEAIAADTWVTSQEQLAAGVGSVHASLSIGALDDYLKSLRSVVEPSEVDALSDSSRRYAWLMRKFQIETYRDRYPEQGYVVSVIRDFPLASMGLVDRDNRWKWSPEDFAWHGETMLVLRTPNDRRSFTSGENVALEFVRVDAARGSSNPLLSWNLASLDIARDFSGGTLALSGDSEGRYVGKLAWQVPVVSAPQLLRMHAKMDVHGRPVSNHWDLWIMPPCQAGEFKVYMHPSSVNWCESIKTPQIHFVPWDGKAKEHVILTRRWDKELYSAAIAGARVIMLPDNSVGSLAVREHWFLRGGPLAGVAHPFWKIYPRAMFRDIQHFDWSGPVLFDSPLSQHVTPIGFLWDNHDLRQYRSHLLAFDCWMGEGRWLASTLGLGNQVDHSDADLLRAWIIAIQDDSVPLRRLSAEWIEAIGNEIGSKAVSLANREWLFAPDKEERGELAKWYSEAHDRADWKAISIEKHWEAQGYESLDGWGWYFTTVQIPSELRVGDSGPNAENLYIQFTGADDYFELFVDGEKLGSGGDRELRQTAFELRKSFIVPKHAIEDGKLAIAVRILDWQGAGGLFRPIYLSNRPIRETAPILVESR
jgi:hypothetical protein